MFMAQKQVVETVTFLLQGPSLGPRVSLLTSTTVQSLPEVIFENYNSINYDVL